MEITCEWIDERPKIQTGSANVLVLPIDDARLLGLHSPTRRIAHATLWAERLRCARIAELAGLTARPETSPMELAAWIVEQIRNEDA